MTTEEDMQESHLSLDNSNVQELDLFPNHGLGIYDDYEVCEDFHDYVWATWTTMEAQPMQVDPALHALIDQAQQKQAPNYDQGTSASSGAVGKPMSGGVVYGRQEVPGVATLDSQARRQVAEDIRVSCYTSVWGVGASGMCVDSGMRPVSASKRPKTPEEAKGLMQEVHQRMPAWKAEKLTVQQERSSGPHCLRRSHGNLV